MLTTIFLCIAVVGLAWGIWRRRQARFAPRSYAIEIWEEDENLDAVHGEFADDARELSGGRSSLSFPAMRMYRHKFDYSVGGVNCCMSDIRRLESGQWEHRLDLVDWEGNRREVQWDALRPRDEVQARQWLEELEQCTKWVPFGDRWNKSIELAYQRFVSGARPRSTTADAMLGFWHRRVAEDRADRRRILSKR